MAATNNPMISGSMASVPNPNPVSATTLHIAGILTTVHGLDLLPPSSDVSSVAVLWLLHPRLQTQECMASAAADSIHAWYKKSGDKSTGLIAVSFDQRNHGTRLVDKLANEAWRQGNKRHAVDMFSIYSKFYSPTIWPKLTDQMEPRVMSRYSLTTCPPTSSLTETTRSHRTLS